MLTEQDFTEAELAVKAISDKCMKSESYALSLSEEEKTLYNFAKNVLLEARRDFLTETKTAQAKAETVDLDAMRDHFEKWMTANGDYPHLIHKHFGGNYLREETSMKWDGFKQGVKYAQR